VISSSPTGALTSIFAGLLFLLILLESSQSSTAATRSRPPEFEESVPTDFVPTEEQRHNYRTQGGNDVVHEIWSVLRDLEPTWKDHVATPPPTGFLDVVWHYAKLTFRLLFMNSPARQSDEEDNETPKITGELQKGVDALRTAAAFDDPDAIFLLAEMNFYGNFSHPRNPKEAFRWYGHLAELDGNSTAQYMLGLMYATGLGGLERDQAKAMLYHTFAAEQGNVRSEMTLAFRHHSGIGTPRDCNQAVGYYKRVADKAMAYWASGPPGGHSFPRNSYRWVEVNGGTYGEGASASSSGPNAPRDSITTGRVDDVLEYLDMRERQGDYNAILTLGKYYYEAPRGYRRNLRKAQRQFMKITRAYWGKDGKVHPKAPKGIEKVAGKAAAYMGRMFLRGEGMEQNFEKALTWFKRGVSNGDSFAQYHLGLIYRDGLGVPKDGVRAATFFTTAAEQSLPIAQSALGVMFLDQGDIETAGRYFELAAAAGVMEAFYYLAELTHQGVGRERNCGLATVYYKVVAEKAEIVHSSFVEANSAYERGDLEGAFIPSLMAAEQGYENAQANVAYLLDRKTSVISVPSIPLLFPSTSVTQRSTLLDDTVLALVYYTRSAKQANVDSLLKMGDYYLSGTGTDEDPATNLDKATTCYTTAAEGHHSAQALWNLGWMHENGIGSVTQDFHMAKRYYDLALEMNKEAYLPATLALTKLRVRSWWNAISGGKINSIRDEEDEAERKRPKTFSEWVVKFLDAAEEMDAQEAAAMREGDEMEFDGVVFREPDMPGGDADYANRERGTGAGAGAGDAYAGAEEWDEFDDSLIETLIIVTLAGVLALLVYARQARQRMAEEERRRLGQGQNEQGGPEQQQQQAQQAQQPPDQGPGQDGGFFPPHGDPEFNNWVAGGIGH